jgi:hypothetical protein
MAVAYGIGTLPLRLQFNIDVWRILQVRRSISLHFSFSTKLSKIPVNLMDLWNFLRNLCGSLWSRRKNNRENLVAIRDELHVIISSMNFLFFSTFFPLVLHRLG